MHPIRLALFILTLMNFISSGGFHDIEEHIFFRSWKHPLIVMPPSTEIVWPVMYVEPGMQRKATIEDISSGSPARLSGAWLKILSLNSLFEKTYTNKENKIRGLTSFPQDIAGPVLLCVGSICMLATRRRFFLRGYYEKKMNSAYSYKTMNFIAIDLALGSRKQFRKSETRFSPFWILDN